MDRRTLLALTLSLLLLMAYQTIMEVYYPTPPPVTTEQPADKSSSTTPPEVAVGKGRDEPVLVKTPPPMPTTEPTTTEPQNATLLSFENADTRGQISLTGARLVDLGFLKHLDKLSPEGKPIHFLHNGTAPKGADTFFGESGFLATPGVKTPERKTVWSSKTKDVVQGEGSIDLTWDNGAGLRFEKSFIIAPQSYLLTIRDRVVSYAEQPVPLYHYAQLVRTEPKEDAGQMLAVPDFQGPMGYLDKTRVQYTYENLRQGDKHQNARTGWAGFSDKYFLAALLNKDDETLKKYYFDHDLPSYRVGFVSNQYTLDPGKEASFETRLFIGPKAIRSLERHGMGLERAIDYGWLHFLAVPLVDIMMFLNDFMNNYGMAIIFLTILVKALFYPLANKSYRSMNAMKKLQPKMEELRKQFGDDKARLNQEMMLLYQTNKVNPLGGCLPIVVQIPVFFALYQVLYLSVEMRHAPFFFWIHDLSVMDPYYVLPVLMGISMVVQTYLNPAPADPIQAKIMLFLPVIFTFMFLSFPAGLVLYWLVNNVLSIAQQGYIMKQMQ